MSRKRAMKSNNPRITTNIHNHTTSTPHTLTILTPSTLSDLRMALSTAHKMHPEDIFVIPHRQYEFVVPREREALCRAERLVWTRHWLEVSEEEAVDAQYPGLERGFAPEGNWVHVYLDDRPCCVFEQPAELRNLADMRTVLMEMGVMMPTDVFLNNGGRKGGKRDTLRRVRLPLVKMEREAEMEVVGGEIYIQIGDVVEAVGNTMEVDHVEIISMMRPPEKDADEAYESQESSSRAGGSEEASEDEQLWMETPKRKRARNQPQASASSRRSTRKQVEVTPKAKGGSRGRKPRQTS
ncbi:hypothetical protein BC937DRAFT_86324 [Endogone sp. FLAS-F59071]|nr:hypothetical protein BC937DRAFT_86324 [Endogone sp. FLAS-F59071]|eukprot:RUS20121.1 hypothetical protein BC937DRAFT_86324 [Endogone sp. FLAS-F59071]